ncbi:MAG: acetyl/propionyl/methylcrotonyl-CoA carboxylase subunit alpha [Acidimicrobiales bacterium]
MSRARGRMSEQSEEKFHPMEGTTRPIKRLLVANRGEIARRVMRTAHAMGISCVAVFSDPDTQSLHVREADLAVRLPGTAATDTYLQIEKIIDAATRTGADAIHPGYGFLSEDSRFAAACRDAGITFVGPSPEVIAAMGSKLAAKDMMARAGVPVLATVTIDTSIIDLADPESSARLLEEADKLPWPVLVKASAGGGGRGMRIVEDREELVEAVLSATREASSAFGDGTVFLEPYATNPRHIEVQIVGDSYGNVIHLNERECSIQRRHQKIVEESPSPAVDGSLRQALCGAAVKAATTIGYVGAGTVEFMLLQDGTFAFLEVNTRIQVEHPVTELVCGVDIVRLQLEIAQGKPLDMPSIRTTIKGHAVEARLYAEDATRDWQPSIGTLHRFDIPETDGIRVDTGVESASVVSPYYDPMLAKVISYGNTREEALDMLASALEHARIHGVTTNRNLLVAILRHPEMVAGKIDTGFLSRHAPSDLARSATPVELSGLYALGAALASQAASRGHASIQPRVPSGWRNLPTQPQIAHFETDEGTIVTAGYEFDRYGQSAQLFIDGEECQDIAYVSATSQEVLLEHRGILKRLHIDSPGDRIYVDGPDGSLTFNEIERFPATGHESEPGSLEAPLPGTVIKVIATVGQHVQEGDLLFALEAMKMEHEIRCPSAGWVTSVYVGVGDQVEAGKILAVVSDSNDIDT